MKVTYDSNNSGGSWWLTDQNWLDLEAAGWQVNWYQYKRAFSGRPYKDGRFLRALASSASREGLSLRAAIAEWEDVTGERASALGCPCCGPPHSFEFEGDNGEWEYYSPDFPAYGDDY